MRSQLRREHLEAIGPPPVPLAPAPRALPVVALQTIGFVITWEGATAALDHLTYNTILVQEEPRYDAPNRISLEFKRPLEDAHLLEWTLLFPTKTLTDLKATAQFDDADPVQIGFEESREGYWSASWHTP